MFVTQPCPIIVDLPARFSKELHETNAKHWDENLGKKDQTSGSYTLVIMAYFQTELQLKHVTCKFLLYLQSLSIMFATLNKYYVLVLHGAM